SCVRCRSTCSSDNDSRDSRATLRTSSGESATPEVYRPSACQESRVPDQPPARMRPWAGPLLSLVLLLLFLGIAASLPYHQLRGGYSDAGAWIHTHILPAGNVSEITGLD